CQPLANGVLAPGDVLVNLFTVNRGTAPAARPAGDEITLFKSAGTAIEDLAGAILATRAG
ncbi:MAG: ornithine cyclodeaminase family protein, partial [Rhodospirillaceae bacterium]